MHRPHSVPRLLLTARRSTLPVQLRCAREGPLDHSAKQSECAVEGQILTISQRLGFKVLDDIWRDTISQQAASRGGEEPLGRDHRSGAIAERDEGHRSHPARGASPDHGGQLVIAQRAGQNLAGPAVLLSVRITSGRSPRSGRLDPGTGELARRLSWRAMVRSPMNRDATFTASCRLPPLLPRRSMIHPRLPRAAESMSVRSHDIGGA